jgi:hypothetical protein
LTIENFGTLQVWGCPNLVDGFFFLLHPICDDVPHRQMFFMGIETPPAMA